MLNEQQNKKMLVKLERALEVFEPYIFRPVGQLEYKVFETKEDFRQVPDDELFTEPGEMWGGEGVTCWFKGTFTPANEYKNQPLFIMPHVGGYEAMLWVNGVSCGTFATKIVVTRHGNHYCDRICAQANPEKPMEIAIEFYAGHYVIGCQPFEKNDNTGFTYPTGRIDICVKNQTVADFIYDLRILTQLVEMSDIHSFRRAEIMNTLTEVHRVLYYSPENVEFDVWMDSLKTAITIMKSSMARKNGDSAPTAVLVGHSHMDTAWLWPIRETIRKNARTISNQLSLMEQFPEYRFIQSSSYHSKMIEKDYPQLFERMKEQIALKRYEPNGAVWVECDCNITSGEAMIRQFLWGQRYTQEKFGYLSDSYWLPDTFGYSAAIPQIMKGFGVKYFLTTKLSWNDTNDFLYDTFLWQGLDSSQVIVHFFDMDTWPDPKGLLQRIHGINHRNGIKCKQASDSRLIAFGYGDGGGGPQFEMIELARRLDDLEGCPRVKYSSVSDYMDGIDQRRDQLPKYSGELYLELHRGTLTGMQQIKKNNRLAEQALRDLEILEVMEAVRQKRKGSDEAYRDLWETLLVNQFHDILPGSCIPEAHDDSIRETTVLIEQADRMIAEKLKGVSSEKVFGKLPEGPAEGSEEDSADDLSEVSSEESYEKEEVSCFTVFNSLSIPRNDVFYIPAEQSYCAVDEDIKTQNVTLLDGSAAVAIASFHQQPLSFDTITLRRERTEAEERAEAGTVLGSAVEGKAAEGIATQGNAAEKSSFLYEGSKLETPFASVIFDERGYISSLIDKRNSRELCGGNLPLNSFLSAEDVPAGWDGWDIDADCMLKLKSDAVLLSRRVVSDGAVEFRIRSEYQVCQSSKILQDMVFYADNPLILFDTKLEWRDKHRLLKAAFDTTVRSQYATHEIQFGNIKRPTTRNNSVEQAMFEVCNHKYTDLSEPGYGISLLNDCKYGISVDGSCMSLSLAKGGLRPDDRGDVGDFRFKYGFLPHMGGFHAGNVIHPAYHFNHKRLVNDGSHEAKPFISISCDNVIIEAVKPCEDSQNAFIVRAYECEGTYSRADIAFGMEYNKLELCDMMERPVEECGCSLAFQPFEIKTIKVSYNIQ